MHITQKSAKFAGNFSATGPKQSGAHSNAASARRSNLLKFRYMYVIVEIQGQQFKAEEGKFLYVHYLGEKAQAGDTVEFDRVLLADKDGEVLVGAPTVEGAKVVCEVAESLVKGDKVIVFKKKRRKGYRRKNGHRQCFSKIVIKQVVA